MRHQTAATAAFGWLLVLATVGVAGCGSPDAPVHQSGPRLPTTPQTTYMYVTYTGWYDNDPPGCSTAYSGCAGGTGAYSDPITLASDPTEIRPGTKVYYPTVEKYFVMGDQCGACERDWRGKGPDGGPHMYHIDLWVGGKNSNEFDQLTCEDGLTQGTPSGAAMLTPVIVNPPRGMPVSAQPLFNAKTGACYGGATGSGTQGQYKNAATKQCIEEPSNGASVGAAARMVTCNGGSSQEIFFEAAFFTINNLCLDTQDESVASGAKLVFSPCLGGPSQQWEINTNGTIAGIQSQRCIAQSGPYLRLAPCTAAATQRWAFTQAKP
ncbi:MAG TPA: ricin-type beta-trefoil lectin domain protein [Streptosporangiaceae bacterium]|nr:ricin-type beta-trefoil lectin domain protein [Streptosporangiaceae bacterium]